jgi:hypothetical protein
VDDDDLQWVHPPRSDSIGCRSKPYGPAEVEVRDETGALVAAAMTNACNHCLVAGLQPDTVYTYTVRVKHEEWASGLRWDWDPATQGLIQNGSSYTNEFRTLPDPAKPLSGPFTFAVIGDFGTGIRRPSTPTTRQREVGLALQRAVLTENVRLILTTPRSGSCSGPRIPEPKTMTGSSRSFSRIATRSTGSRSARRSAITTPARPRSATIATR